MKQLLEWMEIIKDVRQHRKVRHSIKDILIIVLLQHLPMRTHGSRSQILHCGMRSI